MTKVIFFGKLLGYIDDMKCGLLIMKTVTKNKLFEAWQYCDDNDKSTEFMLQYMQDFAGVDLDCVVNFMQKTTDEERTNWLKSKQN